MTFFFEEARPSDSPFIETIWRVESERGRDFTSIAECHSEIVVARCAGETRVTVRGPETRATAASAPADGEFMGIVFKLGVFMPGLLPRDLMDRRDADLPVASSRSFWLDSSVWEIPDYDNADNFVERLARAGLLAHDPVVGDALRGHLAAFSPRTLQYRFVRATGLSQKAIRQIERARRAAAFLESGMSILDTAYATGYFDQAHLTNALQRFLGQTPAQIARARREEYQPAQP
jgi:AraC-like DNA-binding protein